MLQAAPADVVGRRITEFYVDPGERAALVERLTKTRRADDILLRFSKPGGRVHWARASATLISVAGESAVLSCFTDVTDQVLAEQALRASEQRLAEQSAALTRLTAYEACGSPCFKARLAQLLETAARTLRVDRTSMWKFDGGRDAILCADLYVDSTRQHQSGTVLPRASAPAYFAALERDRIIVANDAKRDAATCEMAADYLAPLGIGAMLDVPLHERESSTIGVLCVEHVGEPRTWTVDEQNFTLSVANLVMAAIADEAREAAVPAARRARGRAEARQGSGRSGDAGEERVPRQHEPRAPDAVERRPRLRAAAAARPRAGAGSSRSARRDRDLRRAPARLDQRRARPHADRGRPRRSRAVRNRRSPPRRRARADDRQPSAQQGTARSRSCRRRRARAGAGRRPPSAPGAVQPARQRRQVHAGGGGAADGRRGGRGRPALRRPGHRHGNRAGESRSHLRRLRPDIRGRRGRRHRARADDQPTPGAHDGRRADGRKHAGYGQRVLVRRPGHAGSRGSAE